LEAKGGYVMLQFGHNDCPGKGPDRETDPNTTFHDTMARYVDEARAAGAIPILVTSLVRRNFTAEGKFAPDDLEYYAAAVRRVAAAKDVALIDLYAISKALAEEMGPLRSERLGPRPREGKAPDHTHLGPEGSRLIGERVAKEIGRTVPALAPYVR
jgi:pectinesterase